MNSKDEFKHFCDRNQTTLFGSFWWWENVVKDSWDVLLYKKGEEVLACLPYHYKYKAGLKAIIPPMLTPYQSISYALPADGKVDKQISFVRKAQEYLIDQVPKNSLFLRQFNCTEQYLLPFYWNDYELKVRYTYLLNTSISENDLFNNLKDSLRREIKKAKAVGVLSKANTIDTLYELKQQNSDKYNEPLSYSKEYLDRIGQLIKIKQASIQEVKIENTVIASLLVCWDHQQVYYTCGAVAPDFRNSGALSWLLWEAILLAKSLNLTFNFEGSMIKQIERYFASFGGTPTPFFEVKRVNSKLLKPLLNKI
tara:strand:+ start:4649 stop:5578 length:930 start_codon:yes stop_codon:yes gene_type:complete